MNTEFLAILYLLYIVFATVFIKKERNWLNVLNNHKIYNITLNFKKIEFSVCSKNIKDYFFCHKEEIDYS